MKNKEYRYKRQISYSFEKTIERAREELKKQGFGILTEINIKEKLKEKLNVDYDNYIILGACNPPFAYEALQTEKDIGLLLPCNVIVYEDDKKVYVSSIMPTVAMQMIENPELEEIAVQIEEKLKKIIDSI